MYFKGEIFHKKLILNIAIEPCIHYYWLSRVKLECEREHQEHLLLSVIPAYIAAEVILKSTQMYSVY